MWVKSLLACNSPQDMLHPIDLHNPPPPLVKAVTEGCGYTTEDEGYEQSQYVSEEKGAKEGKCSKCGASKAEEKEWEVERQEEGPERFFFVFFV